MIFLRPWFLLALLVPFLIKGMRHFAKEETPWARFIDKKLLNALLVKSGPEAPRKTLWLSGMLWCMWCLALAGPAFYKLPTPAVESAPNTVIVFDLSMQGKNLLQGQAKLYDLLSALQGERVGLVVFGNARGYSAMPLTPDIALVKEIVPTLNAGVLPVPATNPQAGFQYAAQLLDHAGQKGRILYITDKSENWQGPYPFGVLDLTKRTADDSDVQSVLQQTKKAENTPYTTFSKQADVWADLGGWIVLFSLPFFALMFRKGYLFILVFFIGFQAEAGFFLRPDQQLYQQEEKAIRTYQQRDYIKAAGMFRKTQNLYNLGNALAFAGDIQGAIEAYAQELKKNPKNQDAKFNKEYLEKQLPPPQEQQKPNEDGESENNKNKSEQDSEQNQQKEQENQSEDQQNQEQNRQQSESEEKEQQANTQPTQDETQQQLEQALADYQKETPYNQDEQQIINRLNHDPSRVLRYRLLLQHQKGQMK